MYDGNIGLRRVNPFHATGLFLFQSTSQDVSFRQLFGQGFLVQSFQKDNGKKRRLMSSTLTSNELLSLNKQPTENILEGVRQGNFDGWEAVNSIPICSVISRISLSLYILILSL